MGGVRIAYIKLVPLTSTEVEALHAEQQGAVHRRLFAHNDSHGPHFLYRPTSAEELRREIEAYRDTDFSRMYWESGSGDVLHYPTKIGRTPDIPNITEFARVGDRLVAESWRSYLKAGLDPFAIALEHTHAIGLEFHAAYRFGRLEPIHRRSITISEAGITKTIRNCAALTEMESTCHDFPTLFVRYRTTVLPCYERWLSTRSMESVCFSTGDPHTSHTKHRYVRLLAAAHGSDPRELADTNPRWLEFCGGVMTDLMRRVREEMDAVSREQGRARRIEVSACVLGLEEENRYFGLDVAAWAREGLIGCADSL